MKEEINKIINEMNAEAANTISKRWAEVAVTFTLMFELKEGSPERESLERICFEAAKNEIDNLINAKHKINEVINFVVEKKKREKEQTPIH